MVFISIFLTFFNKSLVLIYGISTAFRISVILFANFSDILEEAGRQAGTAGGQPFHSGSVDP